MFGDPPAAEPVPVKIEEWHACKATAVGLDGGLAPEEAPAGETLLPAVGALVRQHGLQVQTVQVCFHLSLAGKSFGSRHDINLPLPIQITPVAERFLKVIFACTARELGKLRA